ncbi:cytochrome P450 [Phlebopus sp. FC_14]|nr:cytochrome P450 [Phlebopus sp. FC_14]
MHHCLLVDELVLRIIGFFADDGTGGAGYLSSRGDVARLARTCRSLMDPALGVLWWMRRDRWFLSYLLLAQAFPFPIFGRIPTPTSKLSKKLNQSMGELSTVLLDRTRKERLFSLRMKVLMLAGYEATSDTKAFFVFDIISFPLHVSASLTWALIELAQNPDVQTKLRNELLTFGADSSYDQFSSNLPYLDAVVHECPHIHPPVQEFTRVTAEDDVIPLFEPSYPLYQPLCRHLGTGAKVFRPERWLNEEGIPKKAQEGHQLVDVRGWPEDTVLSVLVKNFAFELRDGAETKIEMGTGGVDAA